MMELLAGILFSVILQDFLLYIGLIFNFKNHNPSDIDIEYPQISIFVPARNEAEYLPFCLESLSHIDYPSDKIEFIIGNDDSNDATEEIINNWTSRAQNRKLLNISPQISMRMNGKANALSQMIAVAKGDYFLFTDADCSVPHRWALEMAGSAIHSNSDLVTGITKVLPKNWFASMQGLDWWLTLGMVKIGSDLGYSITSMGNNMLISRKAYEAIGGFEGLPLSVTEDFEIAKAVNNKKLKAIHQISRDNLIETHAQLNFHNLLVQRKRWLKGAMGLPFLWKFMLGLQVIYFPAIIIFMCFNPGLGLALWIAKILTQALFIKDFARPTGTIILPFYLITFELYYLFVSWSTLVYYFWPVNIKWKGRHYA